MDEWRAAVLVQDAKYQWNEPHKLDERSVVYYSFYKSKKVQILLQLLVTVNILLTFFETPSEIALPMWATVVIEVVTLAFFGAELILVISVLESHKLVLPWRRHGLLGVCLLLMVVDLAFAGAMPSYRRYRLGRLLRIYLITYHARFVRHGFLALWRSLSAILNVVVLLFAFVLAYAVFMTLLWRDTTEGAAYFADLGRGFISTYVLMTRENSPDVFIPAYKESWWSILPFMLFGILGSYVLVAVVLAVVFNQFSKRVKEREYDSMVFEQTTLERAYYFVARGREGIDHETFLAMYRIIRPKMKPECLEVLWDALSQRSASCSLPQFLELVDLMNIRITFEPRSLVDTSLFPALKRLVKHWVFEWVVLACIIANIVTVAVLFRAGSYNLQYALPSIIFAGLFLVEAILRMYSTGPRKYLRDNWNKFDSLVLVLSIVAIIAAAFNPTFANYVTYVQLFRFARIWITLQRVERLRTIVNTVVHTWPAFKTYATVNFCVFYAYALVGMAIWGSVMTQDNPAVQGTEFGDRSYWLLNFGDMSQAMVTLFVLMLSHNWQTITSGYVAVSSEAAWLYFISFNVVAVLIVGKIVVSFVIEAFEMELHKKGTSEFEDMRLRLTRRAEEMFPGYEWTIAPKQTLRHIMKELYWTQFRDAANEQRAKMAETAAVAIPPSPTDSPMMSPVAGPRFPRSSVGGDEAATRGANLRVPLLPSEASLHAPVETWASPPAQATAAGLGVGWPTASDEPGG